MCPCDTAMSMALARELSIASIARKVWSNISLIFATPCNIAITLALVECHVLSGERPIARQRHLQAG